MKNLLIIFAIAMIWRTVIYNEQARIDSYTAPTSEQERIQIHKDNFNMIRHELLNRVQD